MSSTEHKFYFHLSDLCSATPTKKKRKKGGKKKTPMKHNKELNLGSIAGFQTVGPNTLLEINSF